MVYLMTRRKLTFNIVLLILSLLWSVQGIQFLWKTWSWIPATAQITDVTSPDGDILGTYADNHGIIHEDIPLYVDGSYQNHRVNADKIKQLIGKEVGILYNPETGQTDKDQRFFAWLSIVVTMTLLIWLIVKVQHDHNRKIADTQHEIIKTES